MKGVLVLAIATLMGAMTPAQEAPILVSPGDVKWGAAPPSLPAGASMSVLAGDPGKEGPFTLRAKLPANYKIPPHWHSTTEAVTVLSGTLHASMGDTFDASKAKPMAAGSFLSLPAKSAHFVFTKEETIIQVNAMGPLDFTYINPSDDPRNSKK